MPPRTKESVIRLAHSGDIIVCDRCDEKIESTLGQVRGSNYVECISCKARYHGTCCFPRIEDRHSKKWAGKFTCEICRKKQGPKPCLTCGVMIEEPKKVRKPRAKKRGAVDESSETSLITSSGLNAGLGICTPVNLLDTPKNCSDTPGNLTMGNLTIGNGNVSIANLDNGNVSICNSVRNNDTPPNMEMMSATPGLHLGADTPGLQLGSCTPFDHIGNDTAGCTPRRGKSNAQTLNLPNKYALDYVDCSSCKGRFHKRCIGLSAGTSTSGVKCPTCKAQSSSRTLNCWCPIIIERNGRYQIRVVGVTRSRNYYATDEIVEVIEKAELPPSRSPSVTPARKNRENDTTNSGAGVVGKPAFNPRSSGANGAPLSSRAPTSSSSSGSRNAFDSLTLNFPQPSAPLVTPRTGSSKVNDGMLKLNAFLPGVNASLPLSTPRLSSVQQQKGLSLILPKGKTDLLAVLGKGSGKGNNGNRNKLKSIEQNRNSSSTPSPGGVVAKSIEQNRNSSEANYTGTIAAAGTTRVGGDRTIRIRTRSNKWWVLVVGNTTKHTRPSHIHENFLTHIGISNPQKLIKAFQRGFPKKWWSIEEHPGMHQERWKEILAVVSNSFAANSSVSVNNNSRPIPSTDLIRDQQLTKIYNLIAVMDRNYGFDPPATDESLEKRIEMQKQSEISRKKRQDKDGTKGKARLDEYKGQDKDGSGDESAEDDIGKPKYQIPWNGISLQILFKEGWFTCFPMLASPVMPSDAVVSPDKTAITATNSIASVSPQVKSIRFRFDNAIVPYSEQLHIELGQQRRIRVCEKLAPDEVFPGYTVSGSGTADAALTTIDSSYSGTLQGQTSAASGAQGSVLTHQGSTLSTALSSALSTGLSGTSLAGSGGEGSPSKNLDPRRPWTEEDSKQLKELGDEVLSRANTDVTFVLTNFWKKIAVDLGRYYVEIDEDGSTYFGGEDPGFKSIQRCIRQYEKLQEIEFGRDFDKAWTTTAEVPEGEEFNTEKIFSMPDGPRKAAQVRKYFKARAAGAVGNIRGLPGTSSKTDDVIPLIANDGFPSGGDTNRSAASNKSGDTSSNKSGGSRKSVVGPTVGGNYHNPFDLLISKEEKGSCSVNAKSSDGIMPSVEDSVNAKSTDGMPNRSSVEGTGNGISNASSSCALEKDSQSDDKRPRLPQCRPMREVDAPTPTAKYQRASIGGQLPLDRSPVFGTDIAKEVSNQEAICQARSEGNDMVKDVTKLADDNVVKGSSESGGLAKAVKETNTVKEISSVIEISNDTFTEGNTGKASPSKKSDRKSIEGTKMFENKTSAMMSRAAMRKHSASFELQQEMLKNRDEKNLTDIRMTSAKITNAMKNGKAMKKGKARKNGNAARGQNGKKKLSWNPQDEAVIETMAISKTELYKREWCEESQSVPDEMEREELASIDFDCGPRLKKARTMKETERSPTTNSPQPSPKANRRSFPFSCISRSKSRSPDRHVKCKSLSNVISSGKKEELSSSYASAREASSLGSGGKGEQDRTKNSKTPSRGSNGTTRGSDGKNRAADSKKKRKIEGSLVEELKSAFKTPEFSPMGETPPEMTVSELLDREGEIARREYEIKKVRDARDAANIIDNDSAAKRLTWEPDANDSAGNGAAARWAAKQLALAMSDSESDSDASIDIEIDVERRNSLAERRKSLGISDIGSAIRKSVDSVLGTAVSLWKSTSSPKRIASSSSVECFNAKTKVSDVKRESNQQRQSPTTITNDKSEMLANQQISRPANNNAMAQDINSAQNSVAQNCVAQNSLVQKGVAKTPEPCNVRPTPDLKNSGANLRPTPKNLDLLGNLHTTPQRARTEKSTPGSNMLIKQARRSQTAGKKNLLGINAEDASSVIAKALHGNETSTNAIRNGFHHTENQRKSPGKRSPTKAKTTTSSKTGNSPNASSQCSEPRTIDLALELYDMPTHAVVSRDAFLHRQQRKGRPFSITPHRDGGDLNGEGDDGGDLNGEEDGDEDCEDEDYEDESEKSNEEEEKGENSQDDNGRNPGERQNALKDREPNPYKNLDGTTASYQGFGTFGTTASYHGFGTFGNRGSYRLEKRDHTAITELFRREERAMKKIAKYDEEIDGYNENWGIVKPSNPRGSPGNSSQESFSFD